MRELLRRLRFLAQRRRRLDELDEEMRLHVELRAAANRRRGLADDDGDAARLARRRFGNALRLREEGRDAWGLTIVDRFGQDLRYSVRHLLKRPGWTATIVLTLALGVGGNTSVFTLVDAVLFRPPATDRPEQLVWLVPQRASGHASNLSYPAYLALRDRVTSMSGVLATSGVTCAIGGNGRPAERVFGAIVSGNYFEVFGVHPALGRVFSRDDDTTRGGHPVAVIADTLWRRRFNSDPGVIGQQISVNGRPFSIVGVAPPGFVGVEVGEDAEIWTPLAMQAVVLPTSGDLLTDPRDNWLQLIGRLRDGVTAARADAELRLLSPQIPNPSSEAADRVTLSTAPVRGGLNPVERTRLAPIFGLLSVVPLLVLAVACANVANVILARHMARRQEIAMRRALGATRGRIVGQLLTEALLLSGLAGLAGIAVSFGLTAVVAHLGEIPAGVMAAVAPGARVFGATLLLTLSATVLFGLMPAITATRFALVPALKYDEATAAGGTRGRLRALFLVAQVSLSLVLVITAGLFVRSMTSALRVDPGFEAEGAAVVSFNTAMQGYDDTRRQVFNDALLERVSRVPGVTSTALTGVVPLDGHLYHTEIETDTPTRGSVSVLYSAVSPGYFDSMRILLDRGRAFTAQDAAAGAPVVIVNRTLAERMWPGADPIGQRLREHGSRNSWSEVVGVARDGKYGSLTEEPRAAYYAPLAQHRAEAPLTLVVRTAGDPGRLLQPLREVVQSLDADLPIYNDQTLAAALHNAVDKQRAAASLIAVSGIIALALATVGIYGVTAHAVTVRTREVGIRLSLGARAGDILRMFVGEGLRLAGIGAAVGIALTVVASRVLSSLLFGLTSTDLVTFAGASALSLAAALVASALPARRAARLDPLRALRQG